jgi:hypothetical protein
MIARDELETPAPRVDVHTTDGRVIDLTGFSPAAAIERLRQAGIVVEMIRETRHYIRKGETCGA